MKKENRDFRLFWFGALAFIFLLAAAVLVLSREAKLAPTPSTPVLPAAQPSAVGPALAVSSSSASVRRPSASAVSRWMQASNDDLARRAEDYQIDAPRRRSETGELEPFRETPLAAGQMRALRDAAPGSRVLLRLFPDVSFLMRVSERFQKDGEDILFAATEGHAHEGRFSMSWLENSARGLLELPTINRAYEVLLLPSGRYVAREWLYTDVVCARVAPATRSAETGIPPAPGNQSTPPAGDVEPGARVVAALNSRPSAVAVIYLDFDGEVVSGTAWNNRPGVPSVINALPARMNAAQIEETWRRVSNHFAVFDVNVTTDRNVYNAAPMNRKTHCVVTPTRDAEPSAGGVAWINSFTDSGSLRKICWTFADQVPADSALICSHEVGHTLNLQHHGRVASGSQPREEYYEGHGTGETGWGPFMGAPYGQNLLQWSKGEYTRANNSAQDDLAIMGTSARIPFLDDDHGSDRNSATLITSGASVTGHIERNTDADVFKVELDTGAQPAGITLLQGTMLDAEIRIYDAAGRLLQTVNPANTLAASTTISLPTWDDVFIEIRGTGKPPVSGDGYSNYSSLGSYTLLAGTGSGTGPAIALMPSSLPGFRANEGTASSSAAVLVRARRLTGPLNVSALAPFEVSLDDSVFSASVQPAPDTTVYVRLAASAVAGVVRGSLSAASTGATPRSLALAGLVFGGSPSGAMNFVADAMDRLHYFSAADPEGPGFQRDYVLQFADYVSYLEGRWSAGVPDREARAETILRMAGFSAATGTFDHGSGYALTGAAFANFARLGLTPSEADVRGFVRTARLGSADPVPISVPAGGFNGLSGAPWGASLGMAGAMRDFFNSRAFRDRYPEVRLMNSATFYNWMRDVMFPGRAMGGHGSEVLVDMMENAFSADYPLLSSRRAIARGAAASFRSVYAGVLTTEARGSSDGSHLEEPFLRRLHMSALRSQLSGDWNYGSASPELSKARLLELLLPPTLSAPQRVELDAATGAVFQASTIDPAAPINRDAVFEIGAETGGPAPAGISVEAATGRVTIAPGSLVPGTHRVAVTALNLAGRSSPRLVELIVSPSAVAAPLGRGAEWMAAHQLDGCIGSGSGSDGDGLCLVTEYLFGLDPTKPDASACSLRAQGSHFHIEWTALKTGARYTVEQSTDLRDWSVTVGATSPEVLGEAGPFHRRLRVLLPRSGEARFYRVRAEFTEPATP